LEPAVMYALMTVILVHPTLDMQVTRPTTDAGQALVAAMQAVGSPNGLPYIQPLLVDTTEPRDARQVITVETTAGTATAVQRYNLIDNNLVKNYRNRLTAAALRLWNAALGDRAVTVVEHTTHPRDISYNVYFGMAMLPMTAFLAAILLGGVLTAQEYEFHTMLEYRLAPTRPELVLAARLTRLALSSLLAAGLVLLLIGQINGYWPDSLWQIGLVLLPVALIGGSLGIIFGLLIRHTLPVLLVGLITSFVGWIIGVAFKPAATVGGLYEFASRLTINTYAVDLLFPHFYGAEINSLSTAWLVLIFVLIGMLVLAAFIYRWRVAAQE
ncbi:MAG: hypothetical protein KC547_10905, partial [Anaerolineae bacterium]|nr:hypothetical protein [Anaerolineae bacterium]